MPKSSKTRPTTDKVRLAVFSIIQDEITGAKVLDLFAGSGSFGIDAISRGAFRVDFVDINLSHLKTNLKGIEQNKYRVFRQDSLRFIKKESCDKYSVIYVDPPYNFYRIEDVVNEIFRNEILENNGTLIYEESIDTSFDSKGAYVSPVKVKHYGGTVIRLFKGRQ